VTSELVKTRCEDLSAQHLNPWLVSDGPSGSDRASPGPRKIMPKVSFDSPSQCR